MLPAATATRYVTPLREGGSLPGLMEASDLGTYVVKFRGAGQGPKALVAEVIAGELARRLGLPVPALVTVTVDPVLADNEPDDEVQDLIRRSAGLNLGVDFLPGALDLDAGAFAVDPALAGQVLWFDALIGNVDRSWRNPNLLFWHRQPYLIDHGASLTFHHNWAAPFDPSRRYDAANHALVGCEPDLDGADTGLAPLVTRSLLAEVTALVPDSWLGADVGADVGEGGGCGFTDRTAVETAYADRLLARLEARARWLPALRATVADTDARVRTAPPRHRPAWLGGV